MHSTNDLLGAPTQLPDAESGASAPTPPEAPVTLPPRSNNPFATETSALQGRRYVSTAISPGDLDHYAFKTLNRILDDMRYTEIFQKHRAGQSGLMNALPHSYSKALSSLLGNDRRGLYGCDVLILNNHLNYVPVSETTELPEKSHVLLALQGLVVNPHSGKIGHFKIRILERSASEFVSPNVDKHEYHVIPKNLVSADDLDSFGDSAVPAANLVEDAFFKSANGPHNHILRVSVYSSEFEKSDLDPISDSETIKNRYLNYINDTEDSGLSPETIPSPPQCFQTLIKVLRGPVLLAPDQPIQTISATRTSLSAKIDVNLLFEKLSFSIQDDDLVPPQLSVNPALKEAYVRKIYELIFRGKSLKGDFKNDFDTAYSFSDNLSLVYRTFNEVDRHICQSVGKDHPSNTLSSFIDLSICTFFQEELIIRCFENTVKSDPTNLMHYVDSFKSVVQYKASNSSSSSTSSGKLRTYYTNMSSRGELVGYSDYTNSLKIIGIEVLSEPVDIDDDLIIGMYNMSVKSDPKNYNYFNKQLRLVASVRKTDQLRRFLDYEIIPVSLALDELGIEEITEDEVVITAFEFKLDEVFSAGVLNANSSEVSLVKKALLSVAVHRRSYILMNYLETKFPDVVNVAELSFEEACRRLDVSLTANDFEVISRFQERLVSSLAHDEGSLGDETLDIRGLRKALRVVATRKDSKVLAGFLNSGQIDALLLPAENWPAGLDNIGNTCYLNSLLQYYFCLKPLRDTVLCFNEHEIGPSTDDSRKIGGRKVEQSEIQRSYQFIYHLQNLFKEMIHTDKRCVQPSKELAYLSFLALSQPVTFRKEDIEEVNKGTTEDTPLVVFSRSVTPEIVQEVTSSEDPPIVDIEEDDPMVVDEQEQKAATEEPRILAISTDQMESTIEVGRQQDVTECIENVIFQIETALEPEFLEKDGEQYDLIKKLFYGKTKQTITPIDNPNAKPRISLERFFSLIINVSDHPKDIYDSLDNYFSEDLVNLEEGLVKKSSTISELPEVLQFHVQRVLFDRERLVAYKSLESIPFGEKIYLDRYLDTEDEDILSKRSEVFKWKSEIRELNLKKDEILQKDDTSKLSIIDTLGATKKFLENRIIDHPSLTIKADTILLLQEQIDSLREELQRIHESLRSLQEKVSSQFSSYTKVGYSIFAIFIHRGEASYGHYWVYIKDPHKNIFRKYNDEIVTEVPVSEVLNSVEGNTATPYYIVYVKDTLEKEYVEPLRRVINKC